MHDDILQLINKLPANKAPGQDDINYSCHNNPASVPHKYIIYNLHKPLTQNKHKVIKVIHIYRKEETCPGNSHPFSLINITKCYTIEKPSAKRVSFSCDEYINILYTYYFFKLVILLRMAS